MLNQYHIVATVFLLSAMIPTSIGYMYYEGSTVNVTELRIDGAPSNIVFIADPHLHAETMDHINDTIEQINDLNPSVVLIGGDFVFTDDRDLYLNHVWNKLDAPVYAVLGNHDYGSGMGRINITKKMFLASNADLDPDTYDVSELNNGDNNFTFAEEVITALESNNVNVLQNEVVTLNMNGQELTIVGLDDCWAGCTQPPEVTTDAFTIYMIHEPECVSQWNNADIVLAGHTHGGQFGLGNIKILGLSGLMTKNGVLTYVTNGIGTSFTKTDMRLFTPPEIVIINPTKKS